MLAQRALYFILLYCSLIIGEHLKSVKAVLEALVCWSLRIPWEACCEPKERLTPIDANA
jgi:hypothetical protein